MLNIQDILRKSDKYAQEIVEIRRDFHKYAEAAWREFRTTSKIIERLRSEGIDISFGLDVVNPDFTWSYPSCDELMIHMERAISQGANPELVKQMQGYTGAIATIDTGKPGPVLALRFDIDCNDVCEYESEDHLPFKEGFASVNKNFCHACGHDGNASMGIITALVLNEVKSSLCGKIKIIFQMGEEGDKGAQSMVERGVLDDVDILLGTHIGKPVNGPAPELIATLKGMFSTTKFDVHITGKNSHAGGVPEQGNHAILAACSAVMMMNSFLQDSRGATRLNVGTIEGGTGRNVIPGECKIRMETRGSTTVAEQRLYNASLDCIKGACDAYGCEWRIEKMGFAPAAEGDEALVQEIIKAAANVAELGSIAPFASGTGGTDDFAFMMQKVQENGGKASYMFIGTDIYGPAHHGKYDFNESALLVGVKCNLAVACRYCLAD